MIDIKSQRICARIDLDAIEYNLETVRKKVADGTKIMAVIKADAYGHGAVQVALDICDRAEWMGVSNIDEAMELRRAGIKNRILILGYVSPDDYYAVVENDITIALFSYADAEKLSECALKMSKKANVHIKVDTGMSRIGYAVNDENVCEICRIARLKGVFIEGIFSHFARADEKDKSFALAQRAEFDRFCEMLETAGVNIGCRHINNSAGIMELDKSYDMVRMGIMLYGLYPSADIDRSYKLCPAMSFVSRVSMVKAVSAGCGISYGHTFVAKGEMRVATVSAGYADGYPRALSNKGEVVISGKRCRILGRVCMDQMMVDVTGAGDVQVGDEAVLFGNEISADEVADAAGTVNYELVCGVSRRVPRSYFKNGECVKTVSYI